MKKRRILVERYDIVSEVKRGLSSVVYFGFDRQMKRPIAIKEVYSDLLTDKTYVTPFIEETKKFAKLVHQNIVRIYDLVESEDGSFNIIMEFIEGFDLKTILTLCRVRDKTLPPKLAAYIVAEIASALDYTHKLNDSHTRQQQNIIHGDISPASIMISSKGEVKLIDFGTTKTELLKTQLVGGDEHKVNWAYKAPEQVGKTTPLDGRADIFSLGIVFYELLTGKSLFAKENVFDIAKAIKKVEIDYVSLQEARIPQDLQIILLRALEKNKADRYQSAMKLHHDLSGYLRPSHVGNLASNLVDFIQSLHSKKRDHQISHRMNERIVTKPTATTGPGETAELEVRQTVNLPTESEPDPETVIDVLRQSPRSYKKFAKIGLLTILTLAIGFAALDFSLLWTPLGQNLYTLIYPSSLILVSLPSGARVILDGKPLQQKTPVVIPKIAAGMHQLMLSLDGYAPAEKSVTLLSNRSIKIGNETIDPGKTFLIRFKQEIRIDSVPQGATVYINGKKFPLLTPFSYQVEVGVPLSVSMKLKRYKSLPEITLNTLEDIPTIAGQKHWTLTILQTTNKSYRLKGIFKKDK